MSCTELLEYSTPFNNNNDILTHRGIMFEMRTKGSALTLQTLELDVRGAGNKLNVAVYVSDKRVTEAHNVESSWSLITTSKLKKNPAQIGGLIIPAFDVVPIKIPANAVKSIYVHMDGAFIDNTVDASTPAGSEAANGADFKLFAGYPVDVASPRFPPTLTVLNSAAPVIAAKFYYSKDQSCVTVPPVVSDMEYAMAVDVGLQVDNLRDVEQATKVVLDNLFTVDEKLISYAQNNGLKIVDSGGVTANIRSYNGGCPSGWQRCDAVVTRVRLEHDNNISEGDVLERLYRYYYQISQEQLKILPPGTLAAYVGLVDAQAEFALKLAGVSQTDEMDEVQKAYLSEQIVMFLNKKMLPDRARAFNFNIDSQTLSGFDAVDVVGIISGAVISVDTNMDFANRVQSAFSKNKEEFLIDLKYNMNFPGPIATDDRHTFFENALNPTLVVTAEDMTRAPTPAPTEDTGVAEKAIDSGLDEIGNLSKTTFLIILAAVIGLIGVIAACYFFKWNAKRKEKELERLEKKEERKKRAMLRDLERAQDEQSTVVPPKSISFPGDNDENPEHSPLKSGSRRGFDDYDPSSFNSHSDRFLDEGSNHHDRSFRSHGGGGDYESRSFRRQGSSRSMGRDRDYDNRSFRSSKSGRSRRHDEEHGERSHSRRGFDVEGDDEPSERSRGSRRHHHGGFVADFEDMDRHSDHGSRSHHHHHHDRRRSTGHMDDDDDGRSYKSSRSHRSDRRHSTGRHDDDDNRSYKSSRSHRSDRRHSTGRSEKRRASGAGIYTAPAPMEMAPERHNRGTSRVRDLEEQAQNSSRGFGDDARFDDDDHSHRHEKSFEKNNYSDDHEDSEHGGESVKSGRSSKSKKSKKKSSRSMDHVPEGDEEEHEGSSHHRRHDDMDESEHSSSPRKSRSKLKKKHSSHNDDDDELGGGSQHTSRKNRSKLKKSDDDEDEGFADFS